MRVLVTGASGFIGSAVVPQLLEAGHQVVGLARSSTSAEAITALGAEAHAGSLDDLDDLRTTAEQVDGVIHLAFKHDIAFTGDFAGAAAADRAAITTFGDALAGSDRPLLIASGLAGLTPGRLATEDDHPDLSVSPRAATEAAALALADRGVRSVSVRFAPTVHGAGDHGFMATLVEAARRNGAAGHVDDGAMRWAAVHRSDAAALVRLALERAEPGAVVHAVGEQGVALRDVAEVLGRGLDLPVMSVSRDDAPAHFGFLAGFVGMDMPASSEATRELLGWSPSGVGLLDDLSTHYL